MTYGTIANKTTIYNIFTGLYTQANAQKTYNSTDASRTGSGPTTNVNQVPISNLVITNNTLYGTNMKSFLDSLVSTYSQFRKYTLSMSITGGYQSWGCGGDAGTHANYISPYTRIGYYASPSGNTILNTTQKEPFDAYKKIEYSKFITIYSTISSLISSNASLSGGTLSYCHASCHASCHCSRSRR